MVKISERMKISESPTLATSAKVNVMKAQGKDILNLTVGEPDFDTHASILNAAVEAIQSNKQTTTPRLPVSCHCVKRLWIIIRNMTESLTPSIRSS